MVLPRTHHRTSALRFPAVLTTVLTAAPVLGARRGMLMTFSKPFLLGAVLATGLGPSPPLPRAAPRGRTRGGFLWSKVELKGDFCEIFHATFCLISILLSHTSRCPAMDRNGTATNVELRVAELAWERTPHPNFRPGNRPSKNCPMGAIGGGWRGRLSCSGCCCSG